MKRDAFLLGLFSVGGQVLILRELVSSFNGDELFIGTALFGWLLSVAVGAALGGRKTGQSKIGLLFVMAAILIPVMVVITRFSPLLVTSVAGEVVPFVYAAPLSVLLMMPIGLVSGRMFPAITAKEHRPAASIVIVYLVEGIGAFVGGVIIAALVGSVYSTLAMAFALSMMIIIGFRMGRSRTGMIIRLLFLSFHLIIFWRAVPVLDMKLESLKYDSFEILSTFDSHYAHQTILSRDGTITLMTDNSVEATWPDPEAAENYLIPPLLYRQGSRDVLYIGRGEFGVMQLADSLTDIRLVMLDPRTILSEILDKNISAGQPPDRIEDDQITFFTRYPAARFDIIIINSGAPDSYKNSRLITERFLSLVKRQLKPGGLICLPTEYNTDNYISTEAGNILATIHSTIYSSFYNVICWPGTMTLFFASDSSIFDVPFDSLAARIDDLKYEPRFINEFYLIDRLNQFRIDRLKTAFDDTTEINSIKRPLLSHQQVIYRSKMAGFNDTIMPSLIQAPAWLLLFPGLLLLFFFSMILKKYRRRQFGLFLYFVAGFVTLAAELLSFYIYQSTAGSLYSEMALLIGLFMVGMAVGVYYSCRINKENLEFPALLLMLTSIVIFLTTWDKIAPSGLLYYHIFFLFTIGLSGGSLFVAATDRYYYGRAGSNRGLGYAVELIGSSLASLLIATLFLPLIGLSWLLISILILILITLIGAVVTAQ